MIKVGKIQVNSDISPKTFLILTVFATFLFLIFSFNAINNIIKVKNYDKISAEIVDIVYRRNKKATSSNYDNRKNNHYRNYMKVNYTYKGNNYEKEQLIAFRFNKKIGDKIDIYVNPNNPDEIANTYINNLIIIMSIFLLIVIVFLIKAYKVRKDCIKSEG